MSAAKSSSAIALVELSRESHEDLPAEQRAIVRFSTAGSVDDGKSTLIGRLLHDTKNLYDDHLDSIRKASEQGASQNGALSFALVTDGLRAEREQGITIDVAYRYFSTPRRHFIMADSPGHEQYTRNMATGASTADVTVILIDARKGVLLQTRRHAFIASLLGVSTFLVAVNKMDLVDFSREVFESIRRDFLTFANKLGIPNIHFIPVAALHGDNIVERSARINWYAGPTLLEALENVDTPKAAQSAEFRFPVQCVLKEKGDFRGYAGRVVSGSIRVGEEVTVLPSRRSTRVQAIEIYDSARGNLTLEEARAPRSVVLTLADYVDVGRGDMIVRSGAEPEVKNTFSAIVVWMSEERFDRRRGYILRHATYEARVFAESLDYRVDMETLNREATDGLGLNDIGRIGFTSPKQLFLDSYRKNRATGNFILIDPETNATVGAGMVVEKHDHGFLPEIAPRAKAPRVTPVSSNLHRETGAIDRLARESALGFPALTLWFTGLSGAGKSAIAKTLERIFMAERRVCYRLDGDNLRMGLNRDLGFSEEDRIENIRRAAEVAQLFNDAGVTALCSFISPYARDRERAREIVGADRFVEVYVSAPLEVCEARDPHGLYRRARRGEISEFTGISSPYEIPQKPELLIDTSTLSLEESVDKVCQYVLSRASRLRA